MSLCTDLKLKTNYLRFRFFQPKVVTASDEAELARQMERAEAENAEVAADDDEDEEDFDNERDGDEGEDEEEGENED